MDENWSPLHFIGEAIEVQCEEPDLLLKKPSAPDQFVWSGQVWEVTRVLSAWRDYGRKGKMARNMQPAHQRLAVQRGSWGVGRVYYRVQVQDGRVFDLYYDRAPGDATDRLGHWFLWREMQAHDPD
jgi:hypothetical protein